jgi:hypothetical protein
MTERFEPDRRLIDRVISPAFVDDLDGLPLPEILERIEACERAVLEYSYYRRLLQGRLDILEAARRGAGSLAAVLPTVLARAGVEAPHVRFRRGHLLELLRMTLPEEMHDIAGVLFPPDPPIRVPEWIPAAGHREIDLVLGDGLLSRLDEATGDEISAAHRRLEAIEREISVVRRQALDAADDLERAALRRLKGPLDPAEVRLLVGWMRGAFARHRALVDGQDPDA